MTDLHKLYDPRSAQEKWLPFWDENGYFDADVVRDKPSHTIMIPLPNVTGALHMGHALNGTLQDLITRYRRMQGHVALWMPGTDHAGIATQAVVERRMLEEEGLTRHDVGREALVNRIWKWKDAYESRILNQLKQLGASCDWRRTRFTLDEICSNAVRRTFFKLFGDGLIYRGKRLVNWDTFLQTAVADDEVFHENINGHFWTFTYPVVDSDERIAFSTTRPETMLGDTAVCVHPSDKRYAHLVGKNVRIPLVDREIPIIADGLLADKELGTGCVKVTPAHDPNDYACGLRNNLEMINILNANGTINENGGEFESLDRYKAREAVVAKMEELGHFVDVEDRQIPIMHSDRSKTPIEPYLSDQWFIRMDNLAQNAMDVVDDGRVSFFPARYAKTYMDWLGEKRDWCISRQLWWGHRIPIWSKTFNGRTTDIPSLEAKAMLAEDGETVVFTDELAEQLSGRYTTTDDGELLLLCVNNGCKELELQLEAAGFEQDEDVLDTWFSSALWPHSTLGWPDLEQNPPLNNEPDASSTSKNNVLDYFYPGSVLVTSRDIITLWVARMVLTGLYNMGDIPFSHVCVHPKILDGFGAGMSKSKGNGVDPLDLIDRYGTDAVRFTIASFAGETQDVRLPISYECPHCEELIDPSHYKLGKLEVVVPKTLKGEFPVPAGEPKPVLVCPNKKCRKESQFSTPLYDADPDVPVARMVSERFEYGRNFCNKLWNASRFAMMNLEGYTSGPVEENDLQLEDRWILSRLSTTATELQVLLDKYQFDAATRVIRDFTWNEFCDWYLEMVKPRLRDDNQRTTAQRVLVTVLESLLKMLHPFAPFITEELWQRLNEMAPERGLPQPIAATESIMIAPWPELPHNWQSSALESRFVRLQETIVAVRNIRAVYNIPLSTPLKLHIRCNDLVAAEMRDVAPQFDNLAKTELGDVGATVQRPSGSAGFALGDADGYIPLEGIIDREAELERQQKERDKLTGFITGHEKKLSNRNFVSKAPDQVVAEVRETLAGLKNQLESVEQIIRDLS